MTHLCSVKVTHTENTIWNRILPTGKGAALSSTPKACGLVFHHPRRRRVRCSVRSSIPIQSSCCRPARVSERLAVCSCPRAKTALGRRQAVPVYKWCWVSFREQSRVIPRECRRALPIGGIFPNRSYRSHGEPHTNQLPSGSRPFEQRRAQ